MSKRYGLLPTECMDRATTLDLQILEVAIDYERYQYAKKTGKTIGKVSARKPSQSEMERMIQKVKKKNDKS